MKITKAKYLQGFVAITLMLALLRLVFPSMARDVTTGDRSVRTDSVAGSKAVHRAGDQGPAGSSDAANAEQVPVDTVVRGGKGPVRSIFFKSDGTPVKNRIMSVPCFADAFPDQNDVQLIAANKWGVSPVADRAEAERRKAELVYVGSNPYVYIDKLHSSIPYLVPRASVLLQDIGRTYFDSLQTKGIPLHKIIVTSVLRSKVDVEKLRGHNGNATQNSCHLYGTTFDVCYNRYKTVEAPGEHRREVRNDTLKWVLAEVLNDMRKRGRCYIKYEVNQGCFHITVK